MSRLPELEHDLRTLYGAPVDDGRYERGLDLALRALAAEQALEARSRRPVRTPAMRRMTPRTLVLLALLLLVLAAVAIAQEEVRRVVFGEPDRAANRIARFQEPGPPDVGINALGEPADSEDALARMVAMASGIDKEQLGAPLYEHTRVLLDATSNGRPAKIVAVPTELGNVCVTAQYDRGGAGTCTERFTAEDPARFGHSITGDEHSIGGLVSDDVIAVSVELVGGGRDEAVFAPNAFAWRSDRRPAYVVLHFRDGHEVWMHPAGRRVDLDLP